MGQYQYILPTVKQIQELAQLHRDAEVALSARLDVQVTAATESDADYAAEVIDGRVDAWGTTWGSLGGNIRAAQRSISLNIDSQQRQIDLLSEAVLELVVILSETRERYRQEES